MKTVFVKKGSSKSYTNLITSSAPLPLEKKDGLRSLLASSSSLWESIMQRHKRLTGGQSYSWSVLWVCLLQPTRSAVLSKRHRAK